MDNEHGRNYRFRQIMKWRGFAVVVVSLLIAAIIWWIWQPSLPPPVDLSTLAPEQWHADLMYFARELPRRHANAFHHISRSEFDQLVGKVDQLIQRSDSVDIPVQFLKITAAVGDAHTSVQLPLTKARFPVRLYWFGEELRVIRATTAAQSAIGLRLSAINQTPLSDIVARVREIISQDETPWYFEDRSPYLIIRPDVLHALGIIDDLKQAQFAFTTDDGAVVNLTLAPVADQIADWHDAYSSPPLYLQHNGDAFWFTALPDAKIIYVIFNHYDWLFFKARKLFSFLDNHADWKLVIDMRGNGGGDYHVGHWCLIKPILRRPALNRHDRLFVITGRATFSAAMSNAAQFRTETNATLLGEPPGEVPNSYQERKWFFLPYSHLQVNYSARHYKFLSTDVRTLMPDREIDPNWSDYRAGVDPVFKYLMSSATE